MKLNKQKFRNVTVVIPVQLFKATCLCMVYLFLALLTKGQNISSDTLYLRDSLQMQTRTLSQQNDSLKQQIAKAETQKRFIRKNNIKINITSLLLNNYSFTAERSLSRKIIFSAGYRFMPNTKLSATTLGKKMVTKLEIEDDEINKASFAGNAFTGEFRFYGGKHQGARGFYLSLYGRYSTIKIDHPYEFSTTGKSYMIPLQADTKMFGGGMMFGVQWLIAKRVTLDWSIIGAHYGNVSGIAQAKTDLSSMSSADKQNLQQDLDNFIEINGHQYIHSTVNSQGVTAKIEGPFAGIRSGLSLGIAF